MKIMIKSDTTLDMTRIGNIIDYISRTSYEDTNYVGKVVGCTLNAYGIKVHVEIRTLKSYTEYIFKECE